MKRFRGKSAGGWAITIAMYGLALTWLYPYIWMLMASLKPTSQVFTTALFDGSISLQNYQFLFDSAEKLNRPFLGSLLNSFFITFSVTGLVVVSSAYIGFAMAKIKFTGRKSLESFIIFQMVLPTMMFTIPLFVLIRQLGLINTYSAMILPAMMSAWGVFMMSQAFKGTPDDYIDAAKLDRATLRTILFKLMMPLNKSIVAIVALFTFTGTWDNFLWPLIVVSDIDKMPLSVLLATFSKQYGVYVGPVMAGSVLQAFPLVLLFIIFRRHFLQGMSLSLK